MGANMIYVVTYIDVRRQFIVQGRDLVKQYQEAGRNAAGNAGINVLEETGRSNRFVVIGIWQDATVFENHKQAAHTMRFREDLKTIYTNPLDERVHHGFAVDSSQTTVTTDAIAVVTHVDVPPPRKDEAEVLLKRFADDSRKDNGNVRFDVFQQIAPRTNHFTTFAVWQNPDSLDSHESGPHRLRFREALWPILGAPYDERVYRFLRTV
jgi:quinol monooxygenase YgiN